MKDYFGRSIPDDVRLPMRRDSLAESLWQYGEAALAERALSLSDEELYEVQLVAAWHYDNDDPRPPRGPRVSLPRIYARAAIEFLEGRPRDTVRQRRRTRPEEERYTAELWRGLRSGELTDLDLTEFPHWKPTVRLKRPLRERLRRV